MRVLSTIAEFRRAHAELAGASLGFVPTMGFLHEGHLELVRQARAENDVVAASIFVNPLQFAPTEDFESYPRDYERDCRLLEETGCGLLLFPDVSEMYPAGGGKVETTVIPGRSATGPGRGFAARVFRRRRDGRRQAVQHRSAGAGVLSVRRMDSRWWLSGRWSVTWTSPSRSWSCRTVPGR